MASHGRRGLRKLLLGSQTSEVLTDGSVPVLGLELVHYRITRGGQDAIRDHTRLPLDNIVIGRPRVLGLR
jgi:hypothetical protein